MKKLSILFAFLCASLMGWAETFCEKVVTTTINYTSLDVKVTVKKQNATTVRVILDNEHITGISAGGTFQQWGNGVWANQDDAVANFAQGWTRDGTAWYKDFVFSTYPTTGNFQIYILMDHNAGTPAVAGFTLTNVDIDNECSGGGDEPAVTYTITVNQPATGGTIAANLSEAAENATITLTATPAEGKELNEWIVMDGSSNPVSVTNNRFTMPASAVTVTATFQDANPNKHTASGHSVILDASYVNDVYTLVITSADDMEGLGGSFWYVNNASTDMRTNDATKSYTVSGDKKTITCVAQSTSAPSIHTPLYINMPSEVNFGNVTLNWEDRTPACSDAIAPTVTAVAKSDITYNSIVLTVTAADNEGGSGIAQYIVNNGDTKIASSTTSSITLTGLIAATTYDNIKVIAIDGCDNESSVYDVESFTTLSRASECEGDLGYFATWNTKRVHYKIEYLPTIEKIRYEVRGYDTQVLDYLEINTTSGNSNSVPIVNGVAVWKQTAPAAGTEMGIQFVFSTDAIGGNEINSENLSSFTGNNEHLVYYKSRDCVADPEPAYAPTTTPGESTIFNDCQIYSILGSDYYSSVGFNGETNAWGGGTATTEIIDGRDVLHIANSNYLERGFNAHDVSGFTHIHFDVWTQEAMNLGMKLMAYEDDGGNPWKECDGQNFTTNAGVWKSVDMALSGFNHSYLQKIQGIYPSNMAQQDVYFTNIYFYKTTDDVSCYETLNLAESKPSEAGYEDENAQETAAAANDGNESSAWVTYADRPASEEWWYVDLKNNYAINKIEVVWGADYSTNYILQTRTEAPSSADKADDAAWVTIATVTDAAANSTKTNTFTTATGRYVRFHSLSRSGNCIRLAELRVFASGYAVTDVNDPTITTAKVASDSENETSVKLHLVAADVEDGAVKTFLLNKGDDNWLPIETDVSDFYTVSDLERGHYSYQVKARDHAGNVSAISTINFDIFNPVENLALNQPVVAGYTPDNPGEIPAKANDGSLTSGWTTYNDQSMDKQWWSVDLGDVYQLASVDLFWLLNVQSDHYLIQVSHSEPLDRSDDTQWYTALEVNETQNMGETESDKNHYTLNTSARYVRFKAITKNASYLNMRELRLYGSAYAEADVNAPEITVASVSYDEDKAILTLQASDTEDGTVKNFRIVNTTTGEKSIMTSNGDNQIIIEGLTPNTLYEFEIQAMDEAANLSSARALNVNVPVSLLDNIALGKTCYAGYEWTNESEKKEKANDGNTATNWVTYGGEDHREDWWWYVDLGSLYHLTSVELYWPDVYFSNNYKIQVRRDAPTEEQQGDDDAWTTVATVTDAAAAAAKSSEVDVVARYVRVKILSEGWIKLAEVRVFADAAVVAFDDAGNNSPIIAANEDAIVNVTINRNISADDTWYTLCLPFDMDAAKVSEVFGASTIATLVSSEDRGSLIHLNFNYVNAIEAGKPYLIKPGRDFVSGTTISNVTIQNVDPSAEGYKAEATHMHFQGTFDWFKLQGEDKRYVSANNELYSPNPNGGSAIGAFRCYFTIPEGSSALAPGRVAKIVFGEQTATGIDQMGVDAKSNGKLLINGVLYIIRDGKTYNAQGILIQ